MTMIKRFLSTSRALQSTVHLGGPPAKAPEKTWQTIQAEEKLYNDTHKARLGLQDYAHYQHRNLKHRSIMEDWIARGPPHLSEYKLTFGKHRGKRLDEVTDSYMVKYLIPGLRNGMPSLECPLVIDAVEDFMKRHPQLESQAGPAKTKLVGGDVLKPVSKRRPGRKPKAGREPDK